MQFMNSIVVWMLRKVRKRKENVISEFSCCLDAEKSEEKKRKSNL
jgi:hypothetical protein